MTTHDSQGVDELLPATRPVIPQVKSAFAAGWRLTLAGGWNNAHGGAPVVGAGDAISPF